jgi:hypothetical protein
MMLKNAPEKWRNHNQKELTRLLSRKVEGLTISDRVWRYNSTIKGEIEAAINLALEDGTSAAKLSREIKKYLNNPDALFRRVRGEDGRLRLSIPASNYHPGQGVYRSASKNAMRLAGNEINLAYRKADLLRWDQMDFVLGYEIQVSPRSSTVCPLCQKLAGKYSKKFYWIGWHVSCRCTAIPILARMDEFVAGLDTGDFAYFGTVKGVPDQFGQWVEENREKIRGAMDRGKLPYFLKDNREMIGRLA